MRRVRSPCSTRRTSHSRLPIKSSPPILTAGCRSADWTSPANGIPRIGSRCFPAATWARRRSRAACSSPTTGRASSSTRGFRSSASCPPGCPGPTDCSRTSYPWVNEAGPGRRDHGAPRIADLEAGLLIRPRRLRRMGRPADGAHLDVFVNALDYVILLGAMIGIAAYGIWRTRGKRDFNTYLKGSGETRWLTIGLSVMATQASAVTFLSTPGQGYESGLGFVQNYFGAPLALILIAVVFLPIYRRLKVYTAYEYLGQRFDSKTRLLGAGLFLLQRGLGAGITIYAPAIV